MMPAVSVNLGNSKPVMLRDLVDSIEGIIGKKAERKFLPMQDGDVDLTYADITLAKQKLGYIPSVPMNEGLKIFKEWFERARREAMHRLSTSSL